MDRSPKTAGVGDIISGADTAISSLFRQARLLARVESLLTGHCDPALATQFQVANIRQDRLILITPTASWATRLRMQSGSLLSLLQSSGYPHLRYIDIRVAPLSLPEPENPARKTLSPAARLALGQLSRLTGKKYRPDDGDGEA